MKGLDDKCVSAWKGEEHEYQQGFSSPSAIMSSSSATVLTAFQPKNVGYFDLHLDEVYGKGDIIQMGKDIYYRDMHLFLGQAKSVAMAKDTLPVQNSLHICLWEDAQAWYVAELSDLQWDDLNGGLGLDNWIEMLLIHFKQSEQAALDALLSLHYTLTNLRNDHSITAYVQTIVRNRKNAGLPTSNQLSLAWNKLDAELQRDVSWPKYDMTIASFIEQLEKRKDMWKWLFSRQPSYRYGQQPYSEQPYCQFDTFTNQSYRQFTSANQPPRRPEYPSNNPSNNNFENAPDSTPYQGYNAQQLNRPPPYNLAGNERQSRHIKYLSKAQYQPRSAYFAESDLYKYEDALPDDNESEIESPPHADVFFNNSSQSRHGHPPYSCCPCGMTFKTSGTLRTHTLDYHGVDTQSNSTKAAVQYVSEHTLQHVTVPPPTHGYTTIQASLFQPNNDLQSICLNTGSTTTFIDRKLVNNSEVIVQKTSTITADGFMGSQVLNSYVDLSIYILTTSSPIKLNTMAYLVNNLRAGVLVGTDTMAREGISLDLGHKKLTIDDTKVNLHYKLPDNPTEMHITTRRPMHEILRKRRLDYAAFSTQFRAKSSTSSPYTQATASSRLRAKPPPKFASPDHRNEPKSHPEKASPYHQMSVAPHLTVNDLYTQFHHAKTLPPSHQTSMTSCHLTIRDLFAHFDQLPPKNTSPSHPHQTPKRLTITSFSNL